MLRALVIAAALLAPSATQDATQDQFADSPLGLVVRGHDGAVVGRVTAVERNAEGDIVAVEIPGAEPPDAPRADPRDVADMWRRFWMRIEGEPAPPRG